MLNIKILDVLVCPICNGSLYYEKDIKELICKIDYLAYPIYNDIPVMLVDEARQLEIDEL